MIRWLAKLLEALTEDKQAPKGPAGLPIEAQNYLDNRIRDAVDRINDRTEHRLREIVREQFRWKDKWLLSFGIFGVFLTIFSFFSMKEFLRKRAEKAAMDYLTTNVTHQAMMETFRYEVTNFTQTQLSPLKEEILQTSNTVFSMRRQIAHEQSALQKRVRLQEAYLGARIGSLNNYVDLKRFSSEPGEVGSLAKGAREEVEHHFETYVLSPEKRILVDPVNFKPLVHPVDQVFEILSGPDSGNRIGAAIALKDLALSNTVESICKHLEGETNLFVIAHLIGAIRRITQTTINILDIEGVQKWWSVNRTNDVFRAPYLEVVAAFKPKIIGNSVQAVLVGDDLVRVLDALIAKEPNACYTRYLKAQIYLMNGKLEQAETEIQEIDSRLPNYCFLFDLRAKLHFRRGETNEAVTALNHYFDLSASGAKNWVTFSATNMYGDMLKDARLRWPPQLIRSE